MEKRVTVQKFHKVVELEDARPSETIYLRHFDRQTVRDRSGSDVVIQRPPQFLTDFRDTHVAAGEKAEFVATLTPTVDPTLQLIWSHNGSTLDVETNRRYQATFALGQVRLTIVDVRMDDAGVYICQAVNATGEAATAGALSVTSRHEYSHSYRSEMVDGSGGQQLNQRRIVEEKTAQHTIERVKTPSIPIEAPPTGPNFLTRFERLRLEEGSNAHLHARLDCDNAEISWLFNGRPLLASERIATHATDGFVALNMYCARLTDSGTYSCVATNRYGSAQLHTDIEVYPKQPSPVLLEDTHRRLAELERHTSEQCRHISRELDQLAPPSQPPRFKTPLRPVVIPELGSALFETHLVDANDERLQIHWFKDDQPLQPASRISTFCSFGYVSLRIDRCVQSDAGLYKCVAVNSAGQDMTSATLTVLPPASIRSDAIEPQTQISESGWMQLQRLEESTDVLTRKRRTIETSEPPPEPPRFLTPLLGKTKLTEGQPLHIEAKLAPESDPRLQVRWYHDGQPLQSASRLQTFFAFGYVSLRIDSAAARDAGNYSCVATNDAGEDQVSGTVHVSAPEIHYEQSLHHDQQMYVQRKQVAVVPEPQPPCGRPPRFIRPLNRPRNPYTEQANLHLEAQVESDETEDGPLQVQWLHNGLPLPSGHRFVTRCDFNHISLDLLCLTRTDSGTYTLVVSNSFGSISDQVSLQVQPEAAVSSETQFPDSMSKLARFEQTRVKRTADRGHEYGVPRFVRQLIDLQVNESAPVHLEARIEPNSDPSLKIQWFKDDHELQSANRISLFCNFGYAALAIRSAELRDAGTYTCIATNAAGTTHSICRLTVIPLPTPAIDQQSQHESSLRQIQHLEDSARRQRHQDEHVEVHEKPRFLGPLHGRTELNEGEHAHFETRVEPQADPELRIEWYKDGVPLIEASRLTVAMHFGFVSLDIRQVETRDAGEYRCVARNRAGEAEVRVRLSVLEQRTIIRDALLEDSWAQIQRMEARSDAGRRPEQELLPAQPPRFLGPLAGARDRSEGEHAHFETRLEPLGDPTLQVFWYHNDRPLPEGHRFRRYFEFGYVALDILYLYAEDSGEYRCEAVNAYGRDEVRVRLQVQPDVTIDRSQMYATGDIDRLQAQKNLRRPEVPDEPKQAPRFILHLQPPYGEYNEGDHARFEGKLEHLNDPNPTIEWFFEGQPLPSGSRYVTRFDFDFVSLDVRQLQASDSGRYRVRVSNQLGSAESEAEIRVRPQDAILTQSQFPESLPKLAQLDHGPKRVQRDQEPGVCQPPKFVRPLHDVETEELRNVHIEARLMPTGDPTMRLEWYKDDRLLPAGHRFRPQYDFDYVALDLLGVYASDAGHYQCVARNAYGSDKTECVIKVHVPAGDICRETQHESSLQQIAYLEGHPHRTQRNDASADPALVAPAKFTRHLIQSVATKEDAHVHIEARITPSGDPTMQVIWLRDGHLLPAGHRYRPQFDFDYVALDLLRVQAEDAGIYQCQIRNAYGEDVSQCEIRVSGDARIDCNTLHPSGPAGIESLQRLEAWTESRQATHVTSDPVIMQPPFFTQPLSPSTGQPSIASSSAITELTLMEGEQLRINAAVQPAADPKLRIEWFLNGQPLPDKSRLWLHYEFGQVQLQLSSVVESDAGLYICRATNVNGEAESSIRLHVQPDTIRVQGQTLHPQGEAGLRVVQQVDAAAGLDHNRPEEAPSITEPPVFRTPFNGLDRLTEAQLLHTQCQLTPAHDSKLIVQWFKDGQLLRASHRIRAFCAFGVVTLQIADLNEDDQGEYVCVARNAYGQAEQSFLLRLQPTPIDSQIPRFVRPLPLQPPPLAEGQSLRVDAHFVPSDDPGLQIIWYKNGQELRHSSRLRTQRDFGCVQLELRQLSSHDVGDYMCVIRNQFGEDRCTMRIECNEQIDLAYQTRGEPVDENAGTSAALSSPPIFGATLPTQVERNEGERLQLRAQLLHAFDAHHEVTWWLNERPLLAGQRYRPTQNERTGECCLELIDLVADDSGVYTCRVRNQFGVAETSCTLRCIAKRSVIEETQLPAQLASTSVQRIQQIETMLQAKQSSRRVESESSAANAPIFLCDLTGAEQPFGEGSVVQLRTQLEPADDVRMQLHWYKDGHELRDSARIKRTNEFGQIGLDISPCWPSDAGVYTCRAENDAGEAIVSTVITCLAQQSVVFDSQLPAEMRQQSIERIARIEQLQQAKLREAIDQEQKRLARQPRFLCPPPAELQVPEGHTARLQCRVQPPDEPSTQVIWLHDQRQLVSSSRVRTTFEFGTCSLEITRLDQRDAGQYTCLVRSEFGECSASTRITCLADTKPTHPDRSLLQDAEKLAKPSPAKPSASSVAPKFLRQLPAQTRVAEGESVCFETQVTPTDDPQLQVHWFKDGQPLRLGSRVHTLHQFGHVRLELTWTITEDAGVYTCKAINAAGSDETIAAVDITRKPSVIMEQQLPANVSLDNLRKLENRAPPELEVPVKSLQPPQFITQMMPLNDLKEGDAAHFECRLVPTDDPKLEVNWYFNGQPLTSGHRYRTMHDFGIVSLDILDVYAEDSGEYTCRAVNQAGQDLTSVSLHCRPKPSLIYQTQLPNKTMEMGIQRLAELESSRTTSTTTTLTPGENRDGAAPDSDQDSRPKLSAPEFVTEPEAQEVIEGEYTRFSARITGHPRPRIFWVINGETVINGSKYKLTYDGIYHLDIPRARQSDNGKVEVFAKNAAGECYACTSLIVRPKHDDYRAVLKNSPRPWYDYKISKYQRERREQELGKVFDEKLTPGGTEIARWKTQQTEEEKRVKVQEHVLHDTAASGSVVMPSNKLMEPVDNDQQTLDRSTVVGKREKTFIERSRETLDRSLPKVAAQSETNLEGKQVTKSVQKQIQQQEVGDLMITRKLKSTETREQEQRRFNKDILVTGNEQFEQLQPPVFTKKLEPLDVLEGDRAVFECQFTGMPAPDIIWFRENFPIQNSNDFTIECTPNRSWLTIKHVYPEDAGVFSVKAENKAGSAKSTANLLVSVRKDFGSQSPPSFSHTLTPVDCKAGELIRLDVIVIGSRPVDVHWLKDGVKVEPSIVYKMLQDGNQHTLLILEAQPRDSGTYECIAINVNGKATCCTAVKVGQGEPAQQQIKSQASVRLASDQSESGVTSGIAKDKAPQVIEELTPVLVNEGSAASFRCRIANIKNIQVAWYKNDSLIKPSRFFRMASERDCFTLTISEAFPEDEGTYKCVATNSAGSVASSAALKLVGPAASVEMYQPQAQIVHEPNEARPPLSKKQLLHQQQLQQQRALHQQRLQQQQQAQQQIQQQQAKVQSQANVQFNPIAPQITPLVAQTAGVGKTVRFETKVSGQPWPTLSWFKDGVALTTDSRISFGSTNSESGCLQIVQVQLGDSGMYTLCAENEGGRSKSTAQLLVVEDEQLLQNAVITTTSKGHDGQQVTQRKQQQLPITAPASTGATSGRSSDRTPSPGKKSGDDKKRKQAKKKSKADKSDRSE